VDEFEILGRDTEGEYFKQLLTQYGAPAYVRRARAVQGAFDALIDRCRRQRDELLAMVRTRLGLLHGLAGAWERLRPLLVDETDVAVLGDLHAELEPQLRGPVDVTSSARVLRRALRELLESIERFNQRWRESVPAIDCSEVNRLRADYNRYYVLEKECAVRSARVARMGFVRLEPVTHADVLTRLPLLPELRMVK
jgi:hypothetical protein